jgi:hypothetical protein
MMGSAPVSSSAPAQVRVFQADGKVLHFEEPILAIQIMQDHPGHLVVRHSSSRKLNGTNKGSRVSFLSVPSTRQMSSKQNVVMLRVDEELDSRGTYYLLPLEAEVKKEVQRSWNNVLGDFVKNIVSLDSEQKSVPAESERRNSFSEMRASFMRRSSSAPRSKSLIPEDQPARRSCSSNPFQPVLQQVQQEEQQQHQRQQQQEQQQAQKSVPADSERRTSFSEKRASFTRRSCSAPRSKGLMPVDQPARCSYSSNPFQPVLQHAQQEEQQRHQRQQQQEQQREEQQAQQQQKLQPQLIPSGSFPARREYRYIGNQGNCFMEGVGRSRELPVRIQPTFRPKRHRRRSVQQNGLKSSQQKGWRPNLESISEELDEFSDDDSAEFKTIQSKCLRRAGSQREHLRTIAQLRPVAV